MNNSKILNSDNNSSKKVINVFEEYEIKSRVY